MNTRMSMILFCVGWAILVLILSDALRHDSGERTPEFFLDMGHSPAPAAQTDALLSYGTPAGSIPRGFLPFPYGPSEADALRAGRELENPFKSDAGVLARGRRVYQAWCAACHGTTGLGDGEVTKRGVPPPTSLLSAESRSRRDGEIYHIITLGRKNMPSHAAQVARDDRWKVIHYIRQIQEGQ